MTLLSWSDTFMFMHHLPANRKEGQEPCLEVTARQLGLAQQMFFAAGLVVVQAHSQHRVSRQPLEARRLRCLEVRLQRLLGCRLIRHMPWYRDLHQWVGQLMCLEGNHHSCTPHTPKPQICAQQTPVVCCRFTPIL